MVVDQKNKQLPELPDINGYQLIQPWEASGSANWAFAQKDGQQWFIKEFGSPGYLREQDGFSKQKVEKRAEKCEAFYRSKEAFYARVRQADTGNLIPVEDFFRYGTKFYAVSKRVDTSSINISDIAAMDRDQKMILLKVLSYSLMNLHAQGIVHADLKPDNVLVKKTERGITMKLIDFDAGFLESSPPRGKDISLDLVFMAPETSLACQDSSVALTAKIDVFSLGLLFHLYYCGAMPEVPETCLYPSEAVLRNLPLGLKDELPQRLKGLIDRMLSLSQETRPDMETVFQELKTMTEKPRGFSRPPNL